MQRLTLLLAAAAASSLLGLGCTSNVYYAGKTAITINGEAHPPRVSKRALKAILRNKKIEILEKVQFELDQAVIKPESDALLADVAQVIRENPQIQRVYIEGHASADGDDAHNLDLSDRRAKAVRDHLITRGGVDASKLFAQGYGETRPISDNNTQEGRERNRRVEFNVDDGTGVPGTGVVRPPPPGYPNNPPTYPLPPNVATPVQPAPKK